MKVTNKISALRLSMAAKLGLSGHWVLRSFTILILSVCLTALGLISTFYTGNYNEAFIDCVLNSTYEYTTFCFRESDELYETEDISPLGQEVIDFIEEETGEKFIHMISYYYDIEDLNCFVGEQSGISVAPSSNGIYVEDDNIYGSFGFNVLAGRYPEDVYEIAVSEKQFEYFKEYGYCDRSAAYYYSGRDKGNNLVWEYDESRVEAKAETINDYDDLIGKKLMCYGDAENGVLAKSGSREGGFYFVEIVGVIDTHADESVKTYSVASDYYHYTPKGKIFYSKKWVEKFSSDGDYISTYMCTQKATTRAETKKYISVTDKTKKFINSIIAEKQAEAKALNATSEGFGLMESGEFDDARQDGSGLFMFFGGVGGVFGAFTIILVIYLTSTTLNGKRRQIGILRAIGAGKWDVRKIVFSGVAFNSAASFVVSVSATFLLYKLWLYDMFYRSYLGAGFVFFNIWNVLILAAFAIVIPLLASLPALFRFSKRSVAEILTDREDTKKRK